MQLMGWGAKLPGKFMNLNPLNPKSDQYLIPPYSNTADPFIKNMRMKEMVAKLKSLHCSTNSPF